MSVSRALLAKVNLHPIVYLVGDKPGKNNIDPNTPFVGTASYKTLLCWLADMDIDIRRVRMFNQSDDPFSGLSGVSLNSAMNIGHIKVVALGAKATEYLMKMNIDEFYSLPHPSPANRASHQPEKLNPKLEQCKTYIYQGAPVVNKKSTQSN